MRSAKLASCFSLTTDTWMTPNGHYSREKVYIDLQRLKAKDREHYRKHNRTELDENSTKRVEA